MSRALSVLVLVLAVTLLGVHGAPAAGERGRLTGGIKYEIPHWFKSSFLEIAEDAAEAAEADRHLMLFMHFDECPYCADMLAESIAGAPYTDWLRKRFDVIAINVRGDREVVFNESLTVTEKELARTLGVRQTPAIFFLDAANRGVMRTDGYRTAADFERILQYVDTKSYLTTTLEDFVRKTADGPHYALRAHPSFLERTDLSGLGGERPLMVLFEDVYCGGCDLLHDTLLADAEVRALLEGFDVVRLDAGDESPMVTPAGETTTARAWAGELDMAARPGFVMFAGGAPRVRIEGVLRHWHFTTALRYLAEREHLRYPTLRAYSRAYQEAQLEAGVVVDLGRQ